MTPDRPRLLPVPGVAHRDEIAHLDPGRRSHRCERNQRVLGRRRHRPEDPPDRHDPKHLAFTGPVGGKGDLPSLLEPDDLERDDLTIEGTNRRAHARTVRVVDIEEVFSDGVGDERGQLAGDAMNHEVVTDRQHTHRIGALAGQAGELIGIRQIVGERHHHRPRSRHDAAQRDKALPPDTTQDGYKPRLGMIDGGATTRKRHSCFLAIAILAGCGDGNGPSDDDLPALGAYAYRLEAPAPNGSGTLTYTGTLTLTYVAEDSIAGTWSVEGYDPAAALGQWNLDAWVLYGIAGPITATHRIGRGRGELPVECGIVYFVGGELRRNEGDCTLVAD